jgi:hypothetical protein
MEEYKIDPSVQYDVVELPSRGIYYTNNKKSVKVAYLTAADENILSAQNLIQSNKLVPELLKRKIIDKDISVDDLVDEDIQAILIFLRNTAFGSDYEIVLIDPKTGEEFKTNCDLSSLNFKPFDLVSDANGEYTYTFVKTNIDITFKFITPKQKRELDEMEKSWNGIGIAPIKTKELEFMIKSIKGNRDPMNIRNMIETLPIKDSQEFRKYVIEKKPGLDLKQTTIAPSGEKVDYYIGFGVEFFRPFFGI